jgi:hypothetical protein
MLEVMRGVWGMRALLTIRIVDQSEGAVSRLSEHILRAQRIAWFSDGLTHPEAAELRVRLENTYDPRAMLQLETLGRYMAYERSAGHPIDYPHTPGLHYAGDVYDSTVLVNDVHSGSLVLELAIPLTAFVAIYIAHLCAKDRGEERQFEARMRTIRAVDDQLQDTALPPETRERLLTRMIDGIGAFDSGIVDGLSVEVAGGKLAIGSHTVRSAPTNEMQSGDHKT